MKTDIPDYVEIHSNFYSIMKTRQKEMIFQNLPIMMFYLLHAKSRPPFMSVLFTAKHNSFFFPFCKLTDSFCFENALWFKFPFQVLLICQIQRS